MFIFGDTNLWIDLNKLHLVPKTFQLLNKVFCMEENMLKAEITYPENLASLLLQYGLKKVSMTETEFQKAFEYKKVILNYLSMMRQLSLYRKKEAGC